eukprot:3411199-Amphidinium_carterae.1
MKGAVRRGCGCTSCLRALNSVRQDAGKPCGSCRVGQDVSKFGAVNKTALDRVAGNSEAESRLAFVPWSKRHGVAPSNSKCKL